MSKPTDEWGTPNWLYNVLNKEFVFDCDVAASHSNHKHNNFIYQEQDALAHPLLWGERNFCNPPYSNILPWYKTAVTLRDCSRSTTCFVTKYDPSTRHGVFAAQEMDEIRIVEHRITFEGAPNCANFPSAIMVCRPRLYTRKTDARIVYVNYKELIK